MNKMLLLLLVCAAACGPQTAAIADRTDRDAAADGVMPTAGMTFPLAPPNARNYKVTFEEDFSAPISLRPETATATSSGRWNQRYWYGAPGWFSAHDDYTTNAITSKAWAGDDMHIQAGGVMTLRADRRPRVNPVKYGKRPFIGSILTTDESFQQRYGYFEARLRTTAHAGYWPTFWLWCKEDGGEIDIAEFQTTEPDHVYASTHQRTRLDAGTGNHVVVPQVDKTDQVAPSGFKITDWHSYGLYWTKDELVWLIDGQEVRRVSPHPFHSPCFIILTNGQGGWSEANKVTTRFPGTFEIDHVRVGAN